MTQHAATLVATATTDVVATRLACYIPTSVDSATWHAIRPWVKETSSRLDLQFPSQVTLAMKALSHIAAWADGQGVPLDTELLLSPDILERYRLTGMRALSERSRATEISRLRRIARSVTVAAPWPAPPAKTGRATISPPYSTAEVAALWSDAQHQSTGFRRHAMAALLTLTLGAGLRPGEIFTVTADNLSDQDGVLAVSVAGTSARCIPVRVHYADRLRSLANKAGAGPIVLSQRQGRDRANALLSTFDQSTRSPALSMTRLRATWLAEVLATPIIVADLLAVAGIGSARALSDVLSHQQHSPPSHASLTALAGATS